MQHARPSWRSTAHRVVACFLLAPACCLPFYKALLPHSEAPPQLSETTGYRVLSRDWWPTSGTPPLEAYAGARSCQQCHAEEALTQQLTPMAHASYRFAVGVWGAKPTDATVRSGLYLYRVMLHADDASLIVRSGNQSISADIAWTFGAGVLGQTFVLESKGKLYDSQISTFRGLHGRMDLTPGHTPAKAGNLNRALGTYLTPETAVRCFGCHTTTSRVKDQFDPEHAIPGITCESCHGPGLAHVVAANMNLVEDAETLIFNPRSLNPVEAVDFCGACHMTSADVVESSFFGPSNVRFPPYRLEKSRCWGVRGDQRLLCFACHDPHKPLIQEASFYDPVCLSCHSSHASQSPGGSLSAPESCPKATENCTTCHMPKYDVPEMHGKFTDHFIRIVRPGEPYPTQ